MTTSYEFHCKECGNLVDEEIECDHEKMVEHTFYFSKYDWVDCLTDKTNVRYIREIDDIFQKFMNYEESKFKFKAKSVNIEYVFDFEIATESKKMNHIDQLEDAIHTLSEDVKTLLEFQEKVYTRLEQNEELKRMWDEMEFMEKLST